MNKFSDGSVSAYAELPVPAAYLTWTRGNAQLRSIAKDDPGAYLGGWRAFVTAQDGSELPKLPLPIVERVSQDGKHPYQVYATNVLSFLPIQHRTRFELRQTVKDEQTGREYSRVTMSSPERLPGYIPYRQVFGLAFSKDSDEFAPAVIKVFKWSSFIALNRAGEAWNKVDKLIPADKALIRRYGTLGKKESGAVVPNFEKYGQGYSTPIEAIGLEKPRFYTITPELERLLEDSLAWKNCERWNASGKVEAEDTASAKSLFLAKCEEAGLTNVEIEQAAKEAGGNYQKAMKDVFGDQVYTEADVNVALSNSEEESEY
jgi:hypothetical protein